MYFLRLFFSFVGRINRAKFWLGFVLIEAVTIATLFASITFIPKSDNSPTILATAPLFALVCLFALTAKRLHDLDMSAWWTATGAAAVGIFSTPHSSTEGIGGLLAAALIIWLGSIKGTQGTNRFGPDPLADTAIRTGPIVGLPNPEAERFPAEDWYVYQNGEQEGPLTYEMLIDKLHHIRDIASVMVWRPSYEDWRPVINNLDFMYLEGAAAVTIKQTYKGKYSFYGLLAGASILLSDYFLQWRGNKFLPWEGDGIPENIGYVAGFCGSTTVIGFVVGFVRGLWKSRPEELSSLPSSLDRESIASRDNRPASKVRYNFIARSWRGEYSIGPTYWGFAFFGNLAAGLVPVLVAASLPTKSDYDPRLILMTMASVWLGVGVIGVWQTVAVWRSANRRIETRVALGKRSPWAGLAKLLVVLGFIRLVAEFFNSGVPQLTEASRMTFLDDPDIPAYSIRVMRNGTEAEIVGGFKYGLTDDFEKILNASRQIKVLHLDSIGGRIGEARRLNKLIRERGLNTYVSAECYSACTIAFAGGRTRTLRDGAKLGFHAPSFPGMSKRELQDMAQDQVKVFTGAGFDRNFVDRALSTPAEQLWTPEADELLAAHVITSTSDGSDFAMSGVGSQTSRDQIGSQLAKAAPIIQTLKENLPGTYVDIISAYYDAFLAGKTDVEAALVARSKLNDALTTIRPMADDQVLVDLAVVIADEYAFLSAKGAKLCYQYATANGDSDYTKLLPKVLLDRERDLNRRAVETARARSTPQRAVIDELLKKLGMRLAAKGVSRQQFDLASSGNVAPSKYAEFCSVWIAIYREIAEFKTAEAATLFRQFEQR
jgi:uncharacterized membrane protein YhaH (DUF805 family)